jgi:hypothetical protein
LFEWRAASGHCYDESDEPPRGLQLQLGRLVSYYSALHSPLSAAEGTVDQPALHDTLVMHNLGYFQFKAGPGVWYLRSDWCFTSWSKLISWSNSLGLVSPLRLCPGRSSQLYQIKQTHPSLPLRVAKFSGLIITVTVYKCRSELLPPSPYMLVLGFLEVTKNPGYEDAQLLERPATIGSSPLSLWRTILSLGSSAKALSVLRENKLPVRCLRKG